MSGLFRSVLTKLAQAIGASYIGFSQSGAGAAAMTLQEKERYTLEVTDFLNDDGVRVGTVSGHDDITGLRKALAALPQRGRLIFPNPVNPATGYTISDTLAFVDKAGCVIDFNNCLINAAGFTGTLRDAVTFKGMSEAVIGDVFVLGNMTYVNRGVFFDADATHISILQHCHNVGD